MYIITLGVLAPFRSMGLGSQLLRRSLEVVQESVPEVKSVELHVQINNDGAIAFYQKYGFQVVETIKDYYVRVEPRDAVLLHLDL